MVTRPPPQYPHSPAHNTDDMGFLKEEATSTTEPLPFDPENANLSKEKKGTPSDQKDMWRMGKAQEMRRNFRFVSIFGFTMLVDNPKPPARPDANTEHRS